MTDPLFKVDNTENKQKSYLKDYITELNSKIKLYNECNTLIKEFINAKSFLCSKDVMKHRFKIFFNYYKNLNSNNDIRNIIEKSFNTTITLIYAEILNNVSNIKNNNDIDLLTYIHENRDDFETMYNIGYANDVMDTIDRYLNSFLVDRYDTKKIKASLEKELESLVNRLENLMNSIEMPY